MPDTRMEEPTIMLFEVLMRWFEAVESRSTYARRDAWSYERRDVSTLNQRDDMSS